MPKISVIMPAYNAAAYIAEAIDSVLTQTYTDFEFIIITDPSKDQTLSLIKKFQQADDRIRIIENVQRRGIAACLNQGLSAAQSPYIARMDADDISLPTRLEKQFVFMEQNPQLGLCGTSYYVLIGNEQYSWELVADPRSELFLRCALLHPSVFFRQECLKTHDLFYDESFLYVEDYEFWTRLKHFTALANIPEKLIIYKKHPAQASANQYKNSMQYTRIVHLRNIWELGIQPTKKELDVQQSLSCMMGQVAGIDEAAVDAWIDKVVSANAERNFYPAEDFVRVLQESKKRLFAIQD
jgi:glycosyltransferase involved in cell wall biosynthesis